MCLSTPVTIKETLESNWENSFYIRKAIFWFSVIKVYVTQYSASLIIGRKSGCLIINILLSVVKDSKKGRVFIITKSDKINSLISNLLLISVSEEKNKSWRALISFTGNKAIRIWKS